jgi:hypothetical protein
MTRTTRSALLCFVVLASLLATSPAAAQGPEGVQVVRLRPLGNGDDADSPLPVVVLEVAP